MSSEILFSFDVYRMNQMNIYTRKLIPTASQGEVTNGVFKEPTTKTLGKFR